MPEKIISIDLDDTLVKAGKMNLPVLAILKGAKAAQIYITTSRDYATSLINIASHRTDEDLGGSHGTIQYAVEELKKEGVNVKVITQHSSYMEQDREIGSFYQDKFHLYESEIVAELSACHGDISEVQNKLSLTAQQNDNTINNKKQKHQSVVSEDYYAKDHSFLHLKKSHDDAEIYHLDDKIVGNNTSHLVKVIHYDVKNEGEGLYALAEKAGFEQSMRTALEMLKKQSNSGITIDLPQSEYLFHTLNKRETDHKTLILYWWLKNHPDEKSIPEKYKNDFKNALAKPLQGASILRWAIANGKAESFSAFIQLMQTDHINFNNQVYNSTQPNMSGDNLIHEVLEFYLSNSKENLDKTIEMLAGLQKSVGPELLNKWLDQKGEKDKKPFELVQDYPIALFLNKMYYQRNELVIVDPTEVLINKISQHFNYFQKKIDKNLNWVAGVEVRPAGQEFNMPPLLIEADLDEFRDEVKEMVRTLFKQEQIKNDISNFFIGDYLEFYTNQLLKVINSWDVHSKKIANILSDIAEVHYVATDIAVSVNLKNSPSFDVTKLKKIINDIDIFEFAKAIDFYKDLTGKDDALSLSSSEEKNNVAHNIAERLLSNSFAADKKKKYRAMLTMVAQTKPELLQQSNQEGLSPIQMLVAGGQDISSLARASQLLRPLMEKVTLQVKSKIEEMPAANMTSLREIVQQKRQQHVSHLKNTSDEMTQLTIQAYLNFFDKLKLFMLSNDTNWQVLRGEKIEIGNTNKTRKTVTEHVKLAVDKIDQVQGKKATVQLTDCEAAFNALRKNFADQNKMNCCDNITHFFRGRKKSSKQFYHIMSTQVFDSFDAFNVIKSLGEIGDNLASTLQPVRSMMALGK